MTQLLPPRTFTCSTATGAVYDHGAHVMMWTPAGTDPVLWMSAKSLLDDASGIRGGVPICFPWFGPGRSKDMAPAHGYARIRSWHFVGETATTDAVTATWTLDARPDDDFQFHAEYHVTFGRTLRLELAVTNTGAAVASFEEALHTYIAIGDIREVRVEGLDGAPYLDKVTGAETAQVGDVTFTGETDRVYRSTADVVLVDPMLDRRIVVTRTGSADAVVWNPWIAKAAAMPDFGDDEWPGMVCIEGANVLANAIELAPGATHTMTYTLRVADL